MTFSAGNRGSYKWGIKTIDNSFFYSNIFDEYVNQIEFVLLVNSSQAVVSDDLSTNNLTLNDNGNLL